MHWLRRRRVAVSLQLPVERYVGTACPAHARWSRASSADTRCVAVKGAAELAVLVVLGGGGELLRPFCE